MTAESPATFDPPVGATPATGVFTQVYTHLMADFADPRKVPPLRHAELDRRTFHVETALPVEDDGTSLKAAVDEAATTYSLAIVTAYERVVDTFGEATAATLSVAMYHADLGTVTWELSTADVQAWAADEISLEELGERINDTVDAVAGYAGPRGTTGGS